MIRTCGRRPWARVLCASRDLLERSARRLPSVPPARLTVEGDARRTVVCVNHIEGVAGMCLEAPSCSSESSYDISCQHTSRTLDRHFVTDVAFRRTSLQPRSTYGSAVTAAPQS